MRAQRVILLADDEVMVRNLVRAVLEADGFEVLAAADGQELLELFHNHNGSIDLILTDLEMPRMGGLSAYREINAERSDTRVLFMSASRRVGLPASVPFLPKPFDLNVLRHEVTQSMEARPLERDSFRIILVVDHNASRKERIRGLLMENGYAVMSAESVQEAKAIADSLAKIDLILTGVVFPDGSGVQLAEHVASSKRSISTLLISHADPDILARMAGFSRQPEFLPNPFTSQALLERVHKLLK